MVMVALRPQAAASGAHRRPTSVNGIEEATATTDGNDRESRCARRACGRRSTSYKRLVGKPKRFCAVKAGLRPIYDALLAAGLKLGKDVRVCPCQTFVPLYRNHVFAQIKPATRTRIDFGLALKDTKTPKRLIDTGGFAKKGEHRRVKLASTCTCHR